MSLLMVGHQKRAAVRQCVLQIPECPDIGEAWQAEMTARRRVSGTTFVRICRILARLGVS